jgi:hypothetical protein
VGPLVVLLFAVLIFEWSAPLGSDLAVTVKSFLASGGEVETGGERALLQEARARYAWLTAVLLNLLVPLFAIVCFAYVAFRTLARRQLLGAASAAAALCIAGMASLFLGIVTDSALHRVIFDFTFDALGAAERFPDAFLRRVLILISTINVLAVIAPSCAVVAFVATVVPRTDRLETVADMRFRIRRLRETLNASAALLVSGILHMNTWLSWSAALVENQPVREAIELLTLSVTVYWGMAFTLMIVAGFVPAMMLLRARAVGLYRQTSGEQAGDTEQWLTEQGFKFSVGGQLPQVAVMLAPLLAGPAASLFGTLANLGQ